MAAPTVSTTGPELIEYFEYLVTISGLVDSFIYTDIMSGLAPAQGLYSEHAVNLMLDDLALLIEGLYNAPLVYDIDNTEYEGIIRQFLQIQKALNFIVIRGKQVHGDLINIDETASAQSLIIWMDALELWASNYGVFIHTLKEGIHTLQQ